jgi:hypothetical protein
MAATRTSSSSNPAEDQLLALEAAEKSLQTAHNLGYEGSYEHKQPTLALESARAG